MYLRRVTGLTWRTLRSKNLIATQRLRSPCRSIRQFSDTVDGKVENVQEEEPKVQATRKGAKKTHTFQAETRELLNIVSNSLYTEKEVFIRELLSNASDALEKARFMQAKGDELIQPETPLEINMFTDKVLNTITIQDYGIGMNEEELISNIGTIARSGSKQFVKAMSETQSQKMDGIIGQFGVGFYSAFMVSDKVEVFSQSVKGGPGHYWVSDGTGTFEMSEADNVERGTKIIVHLKPDLAEYADKYRVETIIKKYSSYLQFPINLNTSKITSTGALWAKQPNSVDDEEHKEFYQLIANTYDNPHYTFHSHFENVKYSIQCLLYIPGSHTEKPGFGRLEPGVSVYSRRVLIKPKAQEILPDWLRFVKGVVDSENIPLHISRENMQDSALIQEISETLMNKVVDFLKRQEKKDPAKFKAFYKDFSGFIKEGCCTDYKNRRKIAYLLRYETSNLAEGELTSIDDYIERMQPDQTDIYYIVATSRSLALASPYLENLKDQGIEVLLCYAQMDDFVFEGLQTYRQKDLVCVEKSKIEASREDGAQALTEDESDDLCKWIQEQFPEKVSEVDVTWRLKNHPVILVDHQSESMRRYAKMLNDEVKLPPQKMQINPAHEIIQGLYKLKMKDDPAASLLCKQIVNNAYIGAGLMEDAREMLDNINGVLSLLVNSQLKAN